MSKRKVIGIICIVLSFTILFGTGLSTIVQENKRNKANLEIIQEFNLAKLETKHSNDAEYHPYRISTNKPIDGVLSIPSIDLELPIFTEVTKKNMNQSVCRVPNTGDPGCNNYCVLGHYMRNYGVIFNRLHEVTVGDLVTVTTTAAEYQYTVTDVLLTKGVDYSLFEDIEGKQLITLLTCDYSIKDGRRVVIGELQKIS